jgi:hypothetical protein
VNRVALAAGLLMSVALCACGAPASGGSTSEPAPSFLPSADAFTSAVVATKALGTARMALTVTRSTAGRTERATATGPTVFGTGLGDLTWSTGTDTFRELVNERGIYRQDEPPTGAWAQEPVGQPTGTSGYADSLRGLGVLRDVVDEGAESLDGVSTRRYRGWLPFDATEAALLGVAPTAVVAPTGDAGAGEVVTVWVDDFGHIVRVDRRAPATGDVVVSSSTTFDDYSLLLDLNTPKDIVSTQGAS